MNEIGEKYLPIGTVVMLKGGSKRVMIAGFCAMAEEAGDKVYDYSGCIYPEGFISSTQTCLFDHEQIEKVYFKGLVDEEEVNFKKKLNLFINQLNREQASTDEKVSPKETTEETIDNVETENVPNSIDSDDDFIKNFPGPIEDAIKYVNSPDEEEVDDDIIELDEEDNNTPPTPDSIMF